MTFPRTAPSVLITLSAALCVLAVSCSPSVVLSVKNDTSGSALFSAEMSPTGDTLVRRFSGTGGSDGGTPLLDKNKIILSLAHAGIKVDSVAFPPKTGLALSMSFLTLDGLLESTVLAKKEGKFLSVTISRESVNAAVDLLPPDTRDFLDLLMAPVFTGENRSVAEYEGDIRAAYGPTLAEELKQSAFSLTVRCPSPVQSAKIPHPGLSTVTDSTVVFTIPLSELLAMEKPFTARVEW